ncbi:MAG: alpha-L-fucosidase [Lachnospiraceae bacterium]
MSEKFKNTKRCYLIDHHSPQPPDVLLSQLDINEYEDFFKIANIDSLMVYCKDHWGVTYYPSEVAGSQQHLGIRKDWIRELGTLLNKMDIEFVAYYCIEYDEGAARKYPQWRVTRPDGTGLKRDDQFAKWSLCCYQTDYREYCLKQLDEIVSNYNPDALFLDIFGASLCYCDNCREKFSSTYQYPLPEEPDALLEHKTDVVQFLNTNAREFIIELKQRVHAIDPSLAVTINFSCHYPQEIRGLLDYQFSEPLLADNWFSSVYARDTAVGQYPILMPGEASKVYNYSTVNEYIVDLSAIVAQGCRVGMYSGSQHIDGTLDFEEARRIGAAFTEIEKMEPYLNNRTPVSCAGILQSDLSMSINLTSLEPDAVLRMKRHNPHQNAVLGAMKLCENAKIPYRILPEKQLNGEMLKQFPLLLLPEVFVIDEVAQNLLEEYVHQGGVLLSSGQSGLWNSDSSLRTNSSITDLLGIINAKIHSEYAPNHWSAYLKNTGQKGLSGLLSCTTPPISEHFIEGEPKEGASVLLTFLLPCVACDSRHWVNWWSPPPGLDSGYPALIHNRYGSGHTYYFAFDFFTMASQEEFQYPKGIFSDILKFENISSVVRHITDYPDVIRTAYFETETTYIIHMVSMIPGQFHGTSLSIDSGYLEFNVPISGAEIVYPRIGHLELEEQNGHVTVPLPSFSLQQIIVCRK